MLIVSDGGANAGIQDPQQLDTLALSAFRADNITTSKMMRQDFSAQSRGRKTKPRPTPTPSDDAD